MTFGAKTRGSYDLKDINSSQETINSYIEENYSRKNNIKKIKPVEIEHKENTSQARLDIDYPKKLRTRRTSDSIKIHCDCGGMCHKTGKNQFKSSRAQRYRCIICKRSKWINLDPNHEKTKLGKKSLMLEQICKGMSLKKAGNTLRNTESRTYTAAGVLNIFRTESVGLKMVCDEIESALNYGKKWSIDESIISAKGGEPNRKIWLLGVIDTETKVVIKITPYDHRPKKKDIANFLSDAVKKVRNHPDTIISDAYAAYKPAIK